MTVSDLKTAVCELTGNITNESAESLFSFSFFARDSQWREELRPLTCPAYQRSIERAI